GEVRLHGLAALGGVARSCRHRHLSSLIAASMQLRREKSRPGLAPDRACMSRPGVSDSSGSRPLRWIQGGQPEVNPWGGPPRWRLNTLAGAPPESDCRPPKTQGAFEWTITA